MHIFDWSAAGIAGGGDGEGRGEGHEGMERDGEVDCRAQLKQGRRLAMAGLTLTVLEWPNGVTDRQIDGQ